MSSPGMAVPGDNAGMTELTWNAGLGAPDSRHNVSMPIRSIMGAETSSALAAPIFLFRWLLVGVAMLAWIVLVPLVDVAREMLRSIAAPLAPYPPAG